MWTSARFQLMVVMDSCQCFAPTLTLLSRSQKSKSHLPSVTPKCVMKEKKINNGKHLTTVT